jgi:hypothetical protein
MTRLALFWPLDPDGYYLNDKGHIRARGERKPIIRDVLKIDGLIRRLVELPSRKTRPANAKGALDFVEKYGFLQHRHPFEHVRTIVARIHLARTLVQYIDRKDWAGVQGWVEQNGTLFRLKPTFKYFEAEDRSDMFFEPWNLTAAIFCQALNDAAAGTEFERCDNPGCPEWFRVGPGTGRARVQRDRRFCSPKCQKQFDYRLRKGEIK